MSPIGHRLLDLDQPSAIRRSPFAVRRSQRAISHTSKCGGELESFPVSAESTESFAPNMSKESFVIDRRLVLKGAGSLLAATAATTAANSLLPYGAFGQSKPDAVLLTISDLHAPYARLPGLLSTVRTGPVPAPGWPGTVHALDRGPTRPHTLGEHFQDLNAVIPANAAVGDALAVG